ncbi:HEAT repeat-containing protein 4-like [Saccoglossus kowalevskii]|uniref:HEAT repeat-containing protein 4-like n=1 Tax=Saccoglossus kowalevskii TaxID=10224 RepID=A0ABM0GGU3_SACKO|nr:HEAT repeat-containing protein 4-like [Saccoglossus kowalevskii]
MATDKLATPFLFPCAAKVKIPQIGSEDSKLRIKGISDIPLGKIPEVSGDISKKYLKKISTDLKFADEVIEQRGAHTLPYDETKLLDAYRYEGLCTTPHKKHVVVGRHNTRGADKKHLPCNLKKRHHHLMPLIVRPPDKSKVEEDEDESSEEEEDGSEVSTDTRNRKPGKSKVRIESPDKRASPDPAEVFLTEANLAARELESQVSKETAKWEEYLLLSLSKNTARWIVSEKTGMGNQQEDLKKLLHYHYGEPQHPTDTIIRDDVSVSDIGGSSEPDLVSRVSKDKNKELYSDKVSKEGFSRISDDESQVEMSASMPLVSFYRLPGGLRRQHKELERELSGAINTTANEIKVVPQKPPPPKTLKDFINPAVGEKVYMTSNQFEQEWLTGARQVHQSQGDKTQLVLDTGNKYKISYLENYPQSPSQWHYDDSSEHSKKKKGSSLSASKITIKGKTKWSKLPEPDDSDRLGIAIQDTEYSHTEKEADVSTVKKARENPSLLKIVDGWRSKWNLGNRWHDSSIEDLVRDMSDIHDHVRLGAIATIARAATFRPPPDPGIKLHGSRNEVQEKDEKTLALHGVLPDKLLACVEKALYDTASRVRITAAIALYTLNTPSTEATRILNKVLRDGDSPERWAASQCLAHAGVCDSFVVGELIQQIFTTDDMVQYEQAMSLLCKLSSQSNIVHSMVAEQLNSTSWKQRLMACKILPRLYGQINKDLTHKLSTLMWYDWHQDVRKIAAQTLGRTGHGKEVHNDLRDRIKTGNERDRVDALTKIGHLGIMTAKLMPVFLSCFNDEYISVRTAAANTAGYLRIQDKQIIRKLLFQTQFDSSWKVKAHAIKGLGMIGLLTEEIGEAVLWALRFETSAGVRAEACHSLVKLGMRGDHVTHILQDRLLVETDEVVREQVALALESLGVSPSGDMDMVQAIKVEVRRLNTRLNIAAKITTNEKQANRELLHERYFSVPRTPAPPPSEGETDKSIAGSRASTRLSSRTNTPGFQFGSEEDEMSLPKTPAGDSSRYLSTLTPPPKTPSRRTPEEKLEKLIEVYDGVVSMKEYRDYIDQSEVALDETLPKRKLADIPETEQEEETAKLDKTEDEDEKQEEQTFTIGKEDKETQMTPIERELKDTMAYHDTIDPNFGESTAEGTDVIEMKHASPPPPTHQSEPESSNQEKDNIDASGKSEISEDDPQDSATAAVAPEESDDEEEELAPEPPVAEQPEVESEDEAEGESEENTDGSDDE